MQNFGSTKKYIFVFLTSFQGKLKNPCKDFSSIKFVGTFLGPQTNSFFPQFVTQKDDKMLIFLEFLAEKMMGEDKCLKS